MAEPYFRSFLGTVFATTSNFALAAAATFGSVSTLSFTAEEALHYSPKAESMLVGSIFFFIMPMFSLLHTIITALVVRKVKNLARPKLKDAHKNHQSIAIILSCPLYLEATDFSEEDLQPHLYHLDKISPKLLRYRFAPLELLPAADHDTTSLQPSDRQQASTGAALTSVHACAGDNKSKSTAPPQSSTGAAMSHETRCFQLPHLDLKYRLAILSGGGLTPNQEQLKAIRAQNRFACVVTLVQALGSLAGIVQRIVRHLGITPIEVISTLVCFLAAMQLLIELFYVSNHYVRPLLLRLDGKQLKEYVDAINSAQSLLQYPQNQPSQSDKHCAEPPAGRCLIQDPHHQLAQTQLRQSDQHGAETPAGRRRCSSQVSLHHFRQQTELVVFGSFAVFLLAIVGVYSMICFKSGCHVSASSLLGFLASQWALLFAPCLPARVETFLGISSMFLYVSSVIAAHVGAKLEWRHFRILMSTDWLPHVSAR